MDTIRERLHKAGIHSWKLGKKQGLVLEKKNNKKIFFDASLGKFSTILEKETLYILYTFGNLVEIDPINRKYPVKGRKS